MPSTTCGHCGRVAQMTPVTGVHQRPDEDNAGNYVDGAFKCANCARLLLALEWRVDSPTLVGSNASDQARNYGWVDADWLPRHQESRAFPDVPRHIGDAATEATLCFSLAAYRAVGALTRAVIEAIAKDKGIAKGNLASKIDALRAADHLREHTTEQAHEVRHFGNDMAHGDFVDTVSREEAEEVLELMVEILDEVYQSPARLARRKEARLAKGAVVE